MNLSIVDYCQNLNLKSESSLLHHAYICIIFYAEAVPKKILELMNVPGLTRENVASHLQVWFPSF
jgi:hypothetical protein